MFNLLNNIWLKSFLITLCLLGAFMILGEIQYSWTLPESKCLSDGYCQCEQIDRSKLISEPINTYSSLFYFYIGLVVFFHASKIGYRRGGVLVLVCASFVTAGSIFYHASASQLGVALDFLGITMILSVFAIWRNFASTKYLRNIILSIIISISTFVAVLMSEYIGLILIPQILILIYSLYILKQELKYFDLQNINKNLYYFLAVYILGGSCWFIANTPGLCDPDSIVQFHSLWHFFGATAIFFSYKYLMETGEVMV